MALLNVVLSTTPSAYARFAYLNEKKNVFGVHERHVRETSFRKDFNLTVRCNGASDVSTSFKPVLNWNDTLSVEAPPPAVVEDVLTRKSFPPDFVFGGSTSAIQTEGALDEGKRGPSSWDSYFQNTEEREIACDSYHRYKDDVKLLKDMGADAYRFSISWSRILPYGRGRKNQEGIQFYKNLIDELLQNGIVPYVTLLHFDLPQVLRDQYDGFVDKRIIDDFKYYAEICFEEFGDKVKNWITINEPKLYALTGKCGPKSIDVREPYVPIHNMLLAHATVTKLYRDKFKATQGGELGLAITCLWFEPFSDSKIDKDAAQRAWAFWMGWVLEPLTFGDYPFIMKTMMGDALPVFTDEEKELLKQSIDFIGFNYYTSRYVKDLRPDDQLDPSMSTMYKGIFRHQQAAWIGKNSKGDPMGKKVAWERDVYSYPDGLRKALVQTNKTYGNHLKIVITENGVPEKRDDTIPLTKALEDDARIKFIVDHLTAIRDAMKDGSNVKGYFVWSMLDLFEPRGDGDRFGLNYVDFKDGLKRYPKKSAKWFRSFNR